MDAERMQLPLYALFAANAVSMVGNVMTMVAVPWFVLQTTGSASQTGVAAFFTALPLVIAGISSGAIVDRPGFKGMAIISIAVAYLIATISMLLIPALREMEHADSTTAISEPD